jgi:hypothetical protein
MSKLKHFFRTIFLINLFKKSSNKRVTEKPEIEKTLSVSINNFYQLSMPVISKSLLDYGFDFYTTMFGSSGSRVWIDSLKGKNKKEGIITGSLRLIKYDCTVIVNLKISGSNVKLNFDVSGRDEGYVDRLCNEIEVFLESLIVSTSYENLNLAGLSIKAVVEKSFFGNSTTLHAIDVNSNKKIYLEEDSAFLINKFLDPSLRSKGKYTALFIGPYGNGKTETSLFLASKSKEYSKSFVYVEDTSDVSEILSTFSHIGALNNLILFIEDVDQTLSGSQRTSAENSILNLIDGVEGKGTDLKIIFTTNHENRLNPALRRNGRIDLLVPFNNPSTSLRKEIFTDFLGSEELGQYAATQTEGINLSVASCVELCKRINLLEENGEIKPEMVVKAVDSLRPHLALMHAEVEQSPREEFSQKAAERLTSILLGETRW